MVVGNVDGIIFLYKGSSKSQQIGLVADASTNRQVKLDGLIFYFVLAVKVIDEQMKTGRQAG